MVVVPSEHLHTRSSIALYTGPGFDRVAVERSERRPCGNNATNIPRNLGENDWTMQILGFAIRVVLDCQTIRLVTLRPFAEYALDTPITFLAAKFYHDEILSGLNKILFPEGGGLTRKRL